MGPAKEATACSACQNAQFFWQSLKNLVLGEKAAAAQVIISGFQRMKGRRKSFLSFFFSISIFLKININSKVLGI